MPGGVSMSFKHGAPLEQTPSAAVFASLAALAGAATPLANVWLPEIALPYPVWPAVLFAAALVAAGWVGGLRDVRFIVATLASVQAGWQLAVGLAATSHPHLMGVLGLTSIGGHLPAGLLAGAVGGFATWLGSAVGLAGMRRRSLALQATGIGAVLGALLWVSMVASVTEWVRDLILFVPWQAGVAVVLGAGMARTARSQI